GRRGCRRPERDVRWTHSQTGGAMDASAVDGPGARILIVEDDLSLRRAMCRGLEQRGHTVTVADDGLDGWQQVQAADPAFDLVITDSRMPRMPGRVLVAMLREQFPEVKVLRVTGGEANYGDDIPSLGKPFTLDELGAAVRKALLQ